MTIRARARSRDRSKDRSRDRTGAGTTAAAGLVRSQVGFGTVRVRDGYELGLTHSEGSPQGMLELGP